jgi:hypothetical protein
MFSTQPDGLWAHFSGLDYCDVVVIEVCGTTTNLNDKRSRYMPSTSSLLLEVSAGWAKSGSAGRGRGGPTRAHWRTAGFDEDDLSTMPRLVPVRHLRALYALPDEQYKKWTPNHAATGYEYFVPHSSLGTFNSQPMQRFLRQMSISSQYYKDPRSFRVNF